MLGLVPLLKFSCHTDVFGDPITASPRWMRTIPRQMMLHPSVVTPCAVLSTNALQLPEY